MPTIQEVERFKAELNSLGHEPEIRAAKGERIQDVSPPEQGLPDDLAELLGGLSDDAQSLSLGAEPSDEETTPADEGAPVFDNLPEGFSDKLPEDALSLEKESLPEAPRIPPGEFEGEALESPVSEEDFSFPEEPGQPEDGAVDLGDFTFEEPDAVEPEPGQPEDGGAGTFEQAGFGDAGEVGDLDLGDLGDLSDLGDLDLGAPESETSAERIEEEPTPELVSEETGLGSEEEAVDLGDFTIEEPGSEDLGIEEAAAEGPGEESAESVESAGGEEFETVDFQDIEALGDVESFEEVPEIPADEASGDEFALPEEEAGGGGEGEVGVEEGLEIEEFSLPEGLVFEKGEEEPAKESAKVSAKGAAKAAAPKEEAPAEEIEGFGLPEDGLPGSGEDVDIDEFNLGDFSEQFGLLLDVKEGGEEREEEINPATMVTGTLQEQEEDVSLSDDDFAALRKTLAYLPRNLRLIVEELIGEQQLSGANLRKVIDLLVRGASPKELAALVGKITGKRIKIPAQYEKKTGLEFEEEKKSFAYLFRHNILPILRIVGIGLAALALVTFLGIRFVYRPINAAVLYRRGYAEGAAERYESGNELFDRATKSWAMKKWFFKYADLYAGKKQYFLAKEKYEAILERFYRLKFERGFDRFRGPGKRKGAVTELKDVQCLLAYARFEMEYTYYENAEKLLTILLDQEMGHYEGLLLAGDNYLEWAERDSGKYENARLCYAELIERYGEKPVLLFRMLRYFIRTGNEREVLVLKDHFQGLTKEKVEPDAYAELGGFLIDRGLIEDVPAVLFRAMKQDRNIPEVHYQLGRYYRLIKNQVEEEVALVNAIMKFNELSPISPRRLAMLIDSHNRLGKNYYSRGKYLDAEEQYKEGIELYRDALRRKIMGRSAVYGELFANLGDILYYQSGDFPGALELYREARQNLYSTTDLSYKIGFIAYRGEDLDSAILEFYKAAGGFSSNRNVLFAIASTLFRRNSHFAAQGYYNQVLDLLEREFETTRYILIDERPDHYALVENLMKTYNNLGVTLYVLSQKSSDSDKFGEALMYLSKSSEYFDWLTRDPETLERNQAADLGYLNSRALLYPVAGYQPRIYTDIPKDLSDLFFR